MLNILSITNACGLLIPVECPAHLKLGLCDTVAVHTQIRQNASIWLTCILTRQAYTNTTQSSYLANLCYQYKARLFLIVAGHSELVLSCLPMQTTITKAKYSTKKLLCRTLKVWQVGDYWITDALCIFVVVSTAPSLTGCAELKLVYPYRPARTFTQFKPRRGQWLKLDPQAVRLFLRHRRK